MVHGTILRRKRSCTSAQHNQLSIMMITESERTVTPPFWIATIGPDKNSTLKKGSGSRITRLCVDLSTLELHKEARSSRGRNPWRRCRSSSRGKGARPVRPSRGFLGYLLREISNPTLPMSTVKNQRECPETKWQDS